MTENETKTEDKFVFVNGRQAKVSPRNLASWRKKALVFSNKIRAELGLAPLTELVKGSILHPNRCTISQSLSAEGIYASTDYDEVYIDRHDSEGTFYAVPHSVGNFIVAFDEGYYPDLVEA